MPPEHGLIRSEYPKTEDLSSSGQFIVQCGKRKRPPLRELKVGRVIRRELEGVGQVQRFAPRMRVGFGVYGNVQKCEIVKRRAAEVHIYATPTHGHSEAIDDL